MAKTPEQIVNHILSGNKKLNIDKFGKNKSILDENMEEERLINILYKQGKINKKQRDKMIMDVQKNLMIYAT